MGNRRLYKAECFHMVGVSESERLKVTALNLWEASRLSFDKPLPGKPPTQPPPSFFKKSSFSYCDAVSKGEGKGRVIVNLGSLSMEEMF
jgi:hypothetical protein